MHRRGHRTDERRVVVYVGVMAQGITQRLFR